MNKLLSHVEDAAFDYLAESRLSRYSVVQRDTMIYDISMSYLTLKTESDVEAVIERVAQMLRGGSDSDESRDDYSQHDASSGQADDEQDVDRTELELVQRSGRLHPDDDQAWGVDTRSYDPHQHNARMAEEQQFRVMQTMMSQMIHMSHMMMGPAGQMSRLLQFGAEAPILVPDPQLSAVLKR